jgi:hypothetical protein
MGNSNLGKNFSIAYTIANNSNTLTYTLTNDLSEASIASINISYLNISGNLNYFSIKSITCPTIAAKASDYQLSGKSC